MDSFFVIERKVDSFCTRDYERFLNSERNLVLSRDEMLEENNRDWMGEGIFHFGGANNVCGSWLYL